MTYILFLADISIAMALITAVLMAIAFPFVVRSNRRLRRENKWLAETVRLQEAAIERANAAVEFADTAGIILFDHR